MTNIFGDLKISGKLLLTPLRISSLIRDSRYSSSRTISPNLVYAATALDEKEVRSVQESPCCNQ